MQQFKSRPQQCVIFRGKTRQQAVVNIKQSKYLKDALLSNLINLADNKDFWNDDKATNRTDYVVKREIDKSTLYSFDALFQLLQAEVANLEFLGKNAIFPQCALVFVDLYSSKVYLSLMRLRKQKKKKNEIIL